MMYQQLNFHCSCFLDVPAMIRWVRYAPYTTLTLTASPMAPPSATSLESRRANAWSPTLRWGSMNRKGLNSVLAKPLEENWLNQELPKTWTCYRKPSCPGEASFEEKDNETSYWSILTVRCLVLSVGSTRIGLIMHPTDATNDVAYWRSTGLVTPADLDGRIGAGIFHDPSYLCGTYVDESAGTYQFGNDLCDYPAPVTCQIC